MITAERIDKARKQLRGGIPEGEIKNELKREGYTDEDIARVFVPHKPDMRSWYLVFGIIFLIAGVWFFSLLLVAASAILLSMYYAERQRAGKI